jgi:hypothetical protein
LSDGTYTFEVLAEDSDGQTSSIADRSFTVSATPPTFKSADGFDPDSGSGGDDTVQVTYSEALDQTSGEAACFEANGTAATGFDMTVGSDDELELTFPEGAFSPGGGHTLDYDEGFAGCNNFIEDQDGNAATSPDDVSFGASDATDPSMSSAVASDDDSDGGRDDHVVVEYTEELSANNPDPSQFQVGTLAASSATVSDSGEDLYLVFPDGAFSPGESTSVNYDETAGGQNVEDTAGNTAESPDSQSLTAQDTSGGPVSIDATARDLDSDDDLSVGDELVVQFNEPMDTGSIAIDVCLDDSSVDDGDNSCTEDLEDTENNATWLDGRTLELSITSLDGSTITYPAFAHADAFIGGSNGIEDDQSNEWVIPNNDNEFNT